MARVSERGESPETGFTSPGAMKGLSAHPRPGYPLVGLRPRRARLRFTRQKGCIGSLVCTQEQASRPGEQQECRGQDGPTECSEETLVFCLDNGVHYTTRWSNPADRSTSPKRGSPGVSPGSTDEPSTPPR